MIDIKRLEKNELDPQTQLGFLDSYRNALKGRNSSIDLLNQALECNIRRKKIIAKKEASKAKQNLVGQDIAKMKRAKEDASQQLKEMQSLSSELKIMEKSYNEIETELQCLLAQLPNICHHSVPVGASEDENKIVRVVGTPKKFSFTALDHLAIGRNLEMIDSDRAGKVTGSRYVFLTSAIAKLERSLTQFMLDLHTEEHGYVEMQPPYIVNAKSLFGTSQLPKFKEDLFKLNDLEHYLIPTAEVPVTNYFSDEILTADKLPQCFTAFTPCFRSEAGSYGRDTHGLIRQHQFHKVELVRFVEPEQSYDQLEILTCHAEKVLQLLELPYRVSALCTGDISFGAAKCYDLEVWLPGQNKYREISSCSNFEDFQARRANIRFRRSAKEKPQFVHTLNGSALAVGRTLVAILENYQEADGSVIVPKVLLPYMKGLTKIELPVS